MANLASVWGTPEYLPLCLCLEDNQSSQILELLIRQHMIPPPIRPRSHAKWQNYKILLKPTLFTQLLNNKCSTTSILGIASSRLVIMFGYPSLQLGNLIQSGKGGGKLSRWSAPSTCRYTMEKGPVLSIPIVYGIVVNQIWRKREFRMKILLPGHHHRLNIALSHAMTQHHHHLLVAIQVGADDPQAISNCERTVTHWGGRCVDNHASCYCHVNVISFISYHMHHTWFVQVKVHW